MAAIIAGEVSESMWSKLLNCFLHSAISTLLEHAAVTSTLGWLDADSTCRGQSSDSSVKSKHLRQGKLETVVVHKLLSVAI